MAQYYSPKIATNGLVLMLDASSKKSYPGSGDAWYDLSGYNNHATLNGGVFSNENNGIIDTSGSSSSIIINDHPSLRFTQEFTLCIWVKFSNIINDSYRALFGKPAFYNYGIIVEWYGDNELLVDFTDSTDEARHGIGGIFPSLTDWNFISYSYKMNGGSNNQAVHLWKPTGLESFYATLESNLEILTSEEIVQISDAGLNIKIGAAYAYNRALSFSEMQQNFNSMRTRFKI